MKKVNILFLLFLSLISCSTDSEEIKELNNNIKALNATVDISGCSSMIFNFSNYGNIEVINDNEFLYVTINAFSGFSLNQSKLHIAKSFSEFPGNGNLPPGKMDLTANIEGSVQTYTYKLNLNDYKNSNGKVLIASHSSFLSSTSVFSGWAGDHNIKKGNWTYFEYTIQDCTPPCTIFAGNDQVKVLTYSEAAALPSWDEVRKLYLSLLDSGVSKYGTFNPSIKELITQFQTQKLGDFTTIYTVINGDCSDSVNLTLRVIPD